MKNQTSVYIPADRNANHNRRGELVVRAPAQRGQLVADLHHGRPDVIEELNLDHRLHAAYGHADTAADDRRLGDRRIETARGAERDLQSLRRFEDATLAFHLGEIRLAAAIGHVLAEDDHTIVAAHLLVQREVDRI